MRKLIFCLLISFLFSCEKIETHKWKCTTEIIITTGKCVPDTIRVIAYHDGMTNDQIVDLQKENTYYSFQIEKSDTVAIIKSYCNCDPFVCEK